MEVGKSKMETKRPFLPHRVCLLWNYLRAKSSLIKRWFLNVRIVFYISYVIRKVLQMVHTQEIFVESDTNGRYSRNIC